MRTPTRRSSRERGPSGTTTTTTKSLAEKENDDLQRLTVVELQKELKRRGLSDKKGKKSEMIARLQEGHGGDDDDNESESDVELEGPSSSSSSSQTQTMPLPSSSTPVPQPAPVGPPPASTSSSQNQPPSQPLPSIAPASTTTPPAQPMQDTRVLRVSFNLKRPTPETIEFDALEKTAVDAVTGTLRSLYASATDRGVVLSKEGPDAEPVYLVDEYDEIFVLTPAFLASQPTPNDPPGTTYFVRRGPLESPNDIFAMWSRWFPTNATLAWTILELFVAIVVTRFLGLNLFFDLAPMHLGQVYRFTRDYTSFAWSDSLILTFAYIVGWIFASAKFSLIHAFDLTWHWPRIRAFRVDAAKQWVSFSQFSKRSVHGMVRPLTLRANLFRSTDDSIVVLVGAPTRIALRWLLFKFWVFQGVLRVRDVLPELLIFVILTTYVVEVPMWAAIILLIPTLLHPSNTEVFAIVSQGNINNVFIRLFENVKKRVSPPRPPASMTSIPILGAPPGFRAVGVAETSLKLRWNVSPDAAFHETTSGATVPVPATKYAVSVRPFGSIGTWRFASFVSQPPSSLFRRPRAIESFFGLSSVYIAAQYAHPALSTLVCVLVACSLILNFDLATSLPNNNNATATVEVDALESDREYEFRVIPHDALGRIGDTAILRARTKARTQTRRMLAVFDDVRSGIKRFAGVNWGLPVDDKDADTLLRTVRAALMPVDSMRKTPNPAKEIGADVVFSARERKNAHFVVTTSYLKKLATAPTISQSWSAAPIIVVHPPGERHTFVAPSVNKFLPQHAWVFQWFFYSVLPLSHIYSLVGSIFAFRSMEWFSYEHLLVLRTLALTVILGDASAELVRVSRPIVTANVMRIVESSVAFVRARSAPIRQRLGPMELGIAAIALLAPFALWVWTLTRTYGVAFALSPTAWLMILATLGIATTALAPGP